ncbi:MAG: hypothetical protein LBQ80_03010 [Clostridium sp.]|jgi:hypothetical protein|nr:hypothetical protein [Clostridium sp.]
MKTCGFCGLPSKEKICPNCGRSMDGGASAKQTEGRMPEKAAPVRITSQTPMPLPQTPQYYSTPQQRKATTQRALRGGRLLLKILPAIVFLAVWAGKGLFAANDYDISETYTVLTVETNQYDTEKVELASLAGKSYLQKYSTAKELFLDASALDLSSADITELSHILGSGFECVVIASTQEEAYDDGYIDEEGNVLTEGHGFLRLELSEYEPGEYCAFSGFYSDFNSGLTEIDYALKYDGSKWLEVTP